MMASTRTVVWCVAACFLQLISANEVQDFIASNVLSDGEYETRIHYKGVTAKETTVAKGYRNGLRFRQLSDGRNFIQLIYDDSDTIRDCEYIRDRNETLKFLKAFKDDLRLLVAQSNVTVDALDGKELPSFAASWFDYHKLKRLCERRHRELQKALGQNATSVIESERRSKRSLLILPGTVWCGRSDEASRYTDLGKMSQTDRCCRKHDHCKRNIGAFTKKYDYNNNSPFTISHCFCDARFKRDLSDLLRVPGTKWCGKGFAATKFTQLGGFSRTDKCCRVHDTSCPFWIDGFQTKYGLFNWRVNTLMHCSCDERFRTCLKMVDTGDSNLVGKIFFDIVQTKCFVLKRKKVCNKYSWWGKCIKKKTIKQAVLRRNPQYK
ncbi:PREDICTED: uncharacterized protein LOC108568467 isoform X1 [Nicrophorus vespilloides]|uniref:phospholipase A2 n=1 Tax=Nicrophorus vespilloides TaxID=110193 RepID=A0ABM1NE20_NICVS|nr:PREDICTED: uncharacterized protein LOC108568467 isoform X1 [Nicrophorus vespilloides]